MQPALAATTPRRSPLLLLPSGLCCAAAVGVVWALLEVYTQRRLSALALPLGWLLGRLLRRGLSASAWFAPVLAAGTLALAALYQQYLLTGWAIAAELGLGLHEALSHSGLGTLLYISTLATTPLAWLSYGLGTLLAAWAAARPATHSKANTP